MPGPRRWRWGPCRRSTPARRRRRRARSGAPRSPYRRDPRAPRSRPTGPGSRRGAVLVRHRAPVDGRDAVPALVHRRKRIPQALGLGPGGLDAADGDRAVAPVQPDFLHEERKAARVVHVGVCHDQAVDVVDGPATGLQALKHVAAAVHHERICGGRVVRDRQHGGGAVRVAEGGTGAEEVKRGHRGRGRIASVERRAPGRLQPDRFARRKSKPSAALPGALDGKLRESGERGARLRRRKGA